MKQSISLKLDLRVLCVLLIVIIAVMLGIWRPWQHAATVQRKVTVTGSATLKATPDEYRFSPSYQSTQTDRTKATAEMTALSDQITGQLKKLGVKDEQIKNNLNDYNYYNYSVIKPTDANVTLNLTITASDKALAQKVQDYLLTTNPSGAITPYAAFSTAKQHELEKQARDQALSDARATAQQTATRLGAKLGKVLSVSDVSGFNGGLVQPTGIVQDAAGSKASSLTLQPGQNEFNFSVNATFAIE